MRRPDAALLTAALLSVTAVAARLLVGPHITDDAYITMRYSRNLSSAGVLAYNPPDAVLGTSTPLWTWMLAAAQSAGARIETASVAVAAAADIGSIVVLLTSPVRNSLAAIGAAAAIAAWPGYVTYAVSGMETSLYVLTIVGFVAALSCRSIAGAAAAASLGALCRPDGALLVVFGFAWTLVATSKRAALKFLVVASMLCAPWSLYAYVRFGSMIPASVRAKAAAADPWWTSLQNLEGSFFTGVYVPLTLLALAGFVVMAAENRSTRHFCKTLSAPLFWRAWSLWAWLYLAAMTAMNAFTHFPWYFVPLLPIYVAAALAAVEGSWRLFRNDSAHASPGVRIAIAAGLAAVLLSRMSPLKSYLDAAAAGRETLYASVAAQLAGVNPRCTVAATEIGTIGYHYPGRVLDLVGLVSPEVVGRPLEAVLAERRPRWLVTYDTHFDRAVASSTTFSMLFEQRSTVRVSDARTLEVYERRDRSGCDTP